MGTGTVSAFKDTKQEIFDIDLLREVAIIVKKHDLNLSVFASSIRIKNKIDERGVSEDKIDSLIDNGNIHCFKRGLTADEYFNNVDKVCALSDNLEMALDELTNHIIQQQLELDKVEKETEDAKVKQREVLHHCNVNMNDLDEYRRNKPLVETFESQHNKLEKAKRQIDYLKKELCNEQNMNYRIKYSQLVSENELNKLITYWIGI